MLRRPVLVILRLSSLVFVGYWAQVHFMTICIFWHLLEIEAKWKNKATPLELKLWRLLNRNLLARIWPGSLLVLVLYLATREVWKKKRIKLKKKKKTFHFISSPCCPLISESGAPVCFTNLFSFFPPLPDLCTILKSQMITRKSAKAFYSLN